MANAALSASATEIPVAAARASRMRAKPFRTKRKSASAERCLRPWGAAIDIVTPTCRKPMISVRGTLSHGGLRKGNPDSQVMTGFYRSPGIAALRPPLIIQFDDLEASLIAIGVVVIGAKGQLA